MKMNVNLHRAKWAMAGVCAGLTAVLAGCGKAPDAQPAEMKMPEKSAIRKKIILGLVAKSQSNPVFQTAYTGAKDAARELGPKYNVEIEIRWATPPDEDAARQADMVRELAVSRADGIMVSCSDANVLGPAINEAVERGTHVMCFDSDAPQSKRFAFYGTDDVTCGQMLAEEMARLMNKKGVVAILSGNQTAPNLQKRVDGVRGKLADYGDMKLLEPEGVFYCDETPEAASEKVNRIQTTRPGIQGWIMVGGWPLFTKNALKWDPGSVKLVSVDALPAELSYVKTGHVQALFAQDCYGWGYRSTQILLEKILNNTAPAEVRVIDPLARVTIENADEWSRNWTKWLGAK